MEKRRLILKSMVIGLLAAPLLFMGAVPQLPFRNDGIGHAGLAQAAGKGGHSDHTTNHHDHDDSSHTDSHVDDGHDSAAMAKKRHRHNGSKSPSGSTKGRGAGSQAVLEKIFERK